MKNKTIFITGGNAGIGLATAILFAREGANVAIFSRRESENASAKAKVEGEGGQCVTFVGDVTDEQRIASALAETVDAFGGLHYAFNNAGVEQVPKPTSEQTVEEFRKVMDVNVFGVWACMKHEIPLIRESGGGCIVNNSSIAGLIGMANVGIYIASKHAVIGLTRSAALEFAKEGVRINAVCPGAVETDMIDRFTGRQAEMKDYLVSLHPMGRVARPEEIGNAVLWLCRDATFTTGQALAVDGGFTAA